jgi:hypothetical protein
MIRKYTIEDIPQIVNLFGDHHPLMAGELSELENALEKKANGGYG